VQRRVRLLGPATSRDYLLYLAPRIATRKIGVGDYAGFKSIRQRRTPSDLVESAVLQGGRCVVEYGKIMNEKARTYSRTARWYQ